MNFSESNPITNQCDIYSETSIDSDESFIDSLASDFSMSHTIESDRLFVNSLASDISEFSDSESDVCLPDLIVQLSNMDEDILLAKHGYRIQETISDIRQGELLIAEIINNDSTKPQTVVIKKIDKLLHNKSVTIQDGINFITSKNIQKEAEMFRYLTVENNTEHIAKYINFFESESYYYLVTEHIDSMNLKEFVLKCHKYIKNGKLNRMKYHKIIKSLLQQIVSTINWLHNSKKCCMLDFSPENIMLSNVNLIENSDGLVHFNSDIKIKLTDFGTAQRYSNSETEFKENIQHISLENEQYLAPNITQQSYYNPKAADLWSFGMITYFMYIGEYPYIKMEETELGEPVKGSAYGAVHSNNIIAYMNICNLTSFVNTQILSLLKGLLNTNENKRFTAEDVIKHPFCKF